jgi:rhodanese-related sulfurtransferase
MYQITKILILLCVTTLTACAQSSNADRVIAPAVFADKIKNVPNAILLDVRTPQEYSAGHIPNALNINYNAPDFQTQIGALDKNKTVLVYCAVGGRSAKSATALQQLGFKEVYDLKGGFTAWKAAGL